MMINYVGEKENNSKIHLYLQCSLRMVITMSTIEQSLRPLFLMCFIVGLGVYPRRQLKSRFRYLVYLSILYFFTIWFIYGCALLYTFTIFPPKILFHSITNMIIVAMINFIAITSAISIFYHHKKFQIYMEKLAAVDDTLEKLGTLKTYGELHMLSRKMIIGWIVHILIVNVYETIMWSMFVKQVFWRYFISHIINYPVHITVFTDLIFIFLLWYIGTKFDKINDYMHCLLLKEKHGLKYMWRKSGNKYEYFLLRHNYKRTLWTIIHLYLELYRITRELNMIFGMQITFGMVLYFGWFTTHCYYIYRLWEWIYQDKSSSQVIVIISVIFWLFTSLIRLYAVNFICESVKKKANNVDKMIHQLTNSLRYADISYEMYFFVLQVMQQPLEFTGLGLFYLGNKFLQKFFSTVLTYVIIMVQLNIQ